MSAEDRPTFDRLPEMDPDKPRRWRRMPETPKRDSSTIPVVSFVCYWCGNGPPGLVEEHGRIGHAMDEETWERACPPVADGLGVCATCSGAFPLDTLADSAEVTVYRLDLNEQGKVHFLRYVGLEIAPKDRPTWGVPRTDRTLLHYEYGDQPIRMCLDRAACQRRVDETLAAIEPAEARSETQAVKDDGRSKIPADGVWRKVKEFEPILDRKQRTIAPLLKAWTDEGYLESKDEPTKAGGTPAKIYRRKTDGQ